MMGKITSQSKNIFPPRRKPRLPGKCVGVFSTLRKEFGGSECGEIAPLFPLLHPFFIAATPPKKIEKTDLDLYVRKCRLPEETRLISKSPKAKVRKKPLKMLKTYNFISKVIIYCLVKGCRKAFLFKSCKKESARCLSQKKERRPPTIISFPDSLSFFPLSAEKQSRTAAFSNGFLCEGLGEGKRGRRTIFHFRICQSVKSDSSQFPSPLRAKTNCFLRKKV